MVAQQPHYGLNTKTPPRDCLVKVKLTSVEGHQIPTFGSRSKEMKFSGQLFSHNFVNPAVKMAILGREFLQANDLVENYRCRYLTQIGTFLSSSPLTPTQPTTPTSTVSAFSPSWPAFSENSPTSAQSTP